MSITTETVSPEIISKNDFEHIARDIFLNRATGEIVVIDPGSTEALLIHRPGAVPAFRE
jgi:hypothetical protein